MAAPTAAVSFPLLLAPLPKESWRGAPERFVLPPHFAPLGSPSGGAAQCAHWAERVVPHRPPRLPLRRGAFVCFTEKHRRGEHRSSAKNSQTKQADGQWPPLRQQYRFPALLGSPLWGRAGAERLRGGWYGISQE